jgi:hypothetical protein
MSAERTAAVSFCDDRVRVVAQHKNKSRTIRKGNGGGGGGGVSLE